jgi:hypothetical protein
MVFADPTVRVLNRPSDGAERLHGNNFGVFALPSPEPSLEGDYNTDGTVDAADYVVWRKNGGPQQEYETWRANFGATASGGAVSNATAPEPPPGVLLLIPPLMAATRRRGWNRAT